MLATNFWPLHAVVKFGTDYFLLKIENLRNANVNLPQNSQLRERPVSLSHTDIYKNCLIIIIETNVQIMILFTWNFSYETFNYFVFIFFL